MIPPPRDWPPGAAEITGYWFLNPLEGYHPPDRLAGFLAAGEKPVCISFGSMIHRQAGRIARDVMKALSVSGRRAVILTGWQDWDVQPQAEVFFLKSAPHGWLFPRCRAVVHHGGAGTTAAALRSGVPNIVVPFAADQLFWAQRLHALGLVPEPVRVEHLTAEWLAGALREVEEPERIERARQLGREIEAEAGVERAVAAIEQHAGMKL